MTMKFTAPKIKILATPAIILSLLIGGPHLAQDKSDSRPLLRKGPLKNPRLTKVDIDGDMNYDGVIDNDDPADNGRHQTTPPGLQLAVGELSKMVVRFKAYDLDYDGELILKLELSGINRADPTGDFSSLAEENKSTGRIRVWKDAKKSVLLLDSSDADKRVVEWVGDRDKLESGVPGGFPRTVYVEGVGISNEFDGDLRLSLMSVYKPASAKKEPYIDAVDHILVTVRSKAIQKDFVNNNAEAVWVTK